MGWILLLGWNHAFRTLSSRFIVSKSIPVAKSQMLSKFQGHKNPHGQNVWNLIFFIWKDKVTQILLEEKSTGVTSSSYISLTMKLLIKSNFTFLGEAVSHFCFR